MEKHREGENAVYYDTFKKMMKYEKEARLIDANGFVSGSRTMLRLHRGLGMCMPIVKCITTTQDRVAFAKEWDNRALY